MTQLNNKPLESENTQARRRNCNFCGNICDEPNAMNLTDFEREFYRLSIVKRYSQIERERPEYLSQIHNDDAMIVYLTFLSRPPKSRVVCENCKTKKFAVVKDLYKIEHEYECLDAMDSILENEANNQLINACLENKLESFLFQTPPPKNSM